MYFVLFGYNSVVQGQLLLRDLKFAQYAHLSPRCTFTVQMVWSLPRHPSHPSAKVWQVGTFVGSIFCKHSIAMRENRHWHMQPIKWWTALRHTKETTSSTSKEPQSGQVSAFTHIHSQSPSNILTSRRTGSTKLQLASHNVGRTCKWTIHSWKKIPVVDILVPHRVRPSSTLLDRA